MHAVTGPCNTLLDPDVDALAAHAVLQDCIVSFWACSWTDCFRTAKLQLAAVCVGPSNSLCRLFPRGR